MPANAVTIDADIMSGTPCFSGTRVPIKNLFDYLEAGAPLADFFNDFPAVQPEAAHAVLESARHLVEEHALVA